MNNDSTELENFKILRSIWKNTYDKILEIKVMNRRSFNDIKKNILEEEKKRIDNKFDKEYQDQYISNKISISETRNNSNLNKMRKRNELMEILAKETLEDFKNFAKPENGEYQKLIKELILQGMVKMLESVCFIRIRQQDVKFVKLILQECEQNFHKLMKEETGREYTCSLQIDETEYLTNEWYKYS
jgi:V-type H+-transporting ATPase subunit E